MESGRAQEYRIAQIKESVRLLMKVLYNSKLLEMNKKRSRKMQVLEMDVLRIRGRMSKMQHIPNTDIKEEMRI